MWACRVVKGLCSWMKFHIDIVCLDKAIPCSSAARSFTAALSFSSDDAVCIEKHKLMP